MAKKKISRKEAIRALWERGILKYKLHGIQQDIYDSINSSSDEITTVMCARRFGKSFLLCLMAVEECLKKGNAIVKYVCPKQKMVQTIIKPIMQEIFKDCPPELRAEFKTNDKMYVFPNGSQIQMAGSDNGHHESLRGGKSDLWMIDEAGFCQDLDYVVNSILAPTTDTTGGRGILASTPSPSPDHEFVTKFVQPAQLKGNLIKYILYDNPMLTEDKIRRIINRYPGGKENDEFRREYLCEIVIDSTKAVVPEFTNHVQTQCIKDWPRPPYFDAYVSMDIGFRDLTVVLFGYYDFKHGVTVIEDEFFINGASLRTDVLAKAIEDKEKRLWFNPVSGETQKPYMRVADNNNLILLNDLIHNHNLQFIPTRKDDKDAALNNMRMKLAAGKIIINSRCRVLIHHLKNATWDNKRKNYEKSPEATLIQEDGTILDIPEGHYDACFLPGNKVLTKKGYKNIEEIHAGEYVLTHNGRFKKVINTMSKDYDGPINIIKPSGREKIYCTPDHNFYVGNVIIDRKGNNTGQKIIKEDSWNKASILNYKEHHLFIPDITHESSIKITKETCFLYGYYVAEGSVGGNGHQIDFAGHKKEKNVTLILEKAVYDSYGKGKAGKSKRSIIRHKNNVCEPRSIKARYYNNRENNSRKICITQSELREELKQLETGINKKFPDFIYGLNKEQAMYMLAGYLFGDGHFSKVGILCNSVSRDIIDGVDILSRKCGYIGNIRYQKRKNRWKSSKNSKDQYIWKIDKQQSIDFLNMIQSFPDLHHIFEDKLIHNIISKNKYNYKPNYKRFSNKSDHYKGKVYNLEVEEDNSYTINGVAVHNCDALVYFMRNVQEYRNPYPEGYGIDYGPDLFINKKPRNKEHQAFIDLFKPINKRKNSK